MSESRATLKRNWPYVVTATLLSVFLWVAVSADRVAERPYTADLLIISSDRRYVETSREPQTEEVTVEFTGRSGDLVRIPGSGLHRGHENVACPALQIPT